MPQPKLVSITFLQPPVVGEPAVASVEEAGLGIWGPTDPRPTPPIYWPGFPGGGGGGQPPMMPPATYGWRFSGTEDVSGWYFMAGPFDKPRPLSGDNVALDPVLTHWTPSINGQGWTLISGPYDKPFPIFGVDPPPDVEPPEEPPVSEGCRWRYTDSGWVLVCGPYPKPKPPGGGGGNTPPE